MPRSRATSPDVDATQNVDSEIVDAGRRHEVLGILALATCILLTLALWSYDARSVDNLIGPVGRWAASVAASAFGIAAWLLPAEFGLSSLRLFARGRSLLGLATLASTLVIVLVGCAMVHLALDGREVFGGHLPGGVLGEVLGEVLRSLLGLTGAFVVGSTILLVTLVLRTPVSITKTFSQIVRATVEGLRSALDACRALLEAWREAKALEEAEREAEREAQAPRIVADAATSREPTLIDAALEDAPSEATKGGKKKKPKRRSPQTPLDLETGEGPAPELEAGSDELHEVGDDEPDLAESPPQTKGKKGPKRAADEAPKIVPMEVSLTPARGSMEPSASDGFQLPSTTLLDSAPGGMIKIKTETLRQNAGKLVEKLEAYGVKGRVDEIHPGPVVTMYEVEPQSGTKVSKIAGLSDDLAMALAAQKVRIVAPIPGKARVGFELPNDERQTVYLRSILEDDRWSRIKANLPIALGQDIAGQPVYGDLSRMPHLLVAGATGSGKSVGLNVMLVSLLMKMTPDEVRLLMIDPKVVELAVFDGIPHMLLPVVTDMNKAALALRWAVDEMERRYQLFADAGARNINTYNERVQRVLDGAMPKEKLVRRTKEQIEAGEPAPEPTKLPYVVVVVDEFADLMMVAAKDVEAAIARLAQKARAAGIHVILATQRPSVDVITGMIKANFPARMAFKVSQREDSKTILGRNGAEHLLGMGDMLMLPPGSSDLKRVHSAFISEDEVRAICDELREQGAPVYDEDILKPREDDGGEGSGASSDDPLYDRAVAVVAQAGYCSISHIQRQLSVGYNKAAKLVEQMEKEGVVGPPSGKAGGRREVLIQTL